jgi:hypothetical protein
MSQEKIAASDKLEDVMLDTRLDVAVECLRFVKAFYGTQRVEYDHLSTALACIDQVQKTLRGDPEKKTA